MSHIFLRSARVTKYLPNFSGLSALLSIYRRVATQDLLAISDFDGDLKLEVSVRETILSLSTSAALNMPFNS